MNNKENEVIFKNLNNDLKKIKTLQELHNLQSKYLGKNSKWNLMTKQIKNCKTNDEKKELGKKIHSIKVFILDEIRKKHLDINAKLINEKLSNNKIDITLPGIDLEIGNEHPISIVIREVKKIFSELGYDIVSGIEVDNTKYNFELLDIPENHPARDENDTFFLTNKKLLRTHCTNVTARTLESLKKDVSNFENSTGIVSIGNVYRRDTDDATHTHQFTQIDLVLLGKNITFANLKWTLEYMCKKLFGDETKIRLRPSYFPFTRLSTEVDISCFYCKNKGCSICKESGWIEILGSGMLSNNVLELCGIPKNLNGLAFGMGIERVAMIKYLINDIRKLYSNNLIFLKQFNYF